LMSSALILRTVSSMGASPAPFIVAGARPDAALARV
jgi:hypothetical protein